MTHRLELIVDAQADGALRRIRLSGLNSLEAFLAQCDAPSLTLVGPWKALTGETFQLLARWAAPVGRGFGVTCPEIESCPATVESPAPEALLVEPQRAQLLNADGCHAIDHTSALQRLCCNTPPAVAVITGHGGEHCVSFGEDWIATGEATGLSGRRIDPAQVRSPVVFLNTCGSLRLGDSVVPKSLSLGARLHAQGTSVVGAFRNQFTFPEAAEWFARWVLGGLSIGEAVSRLNQESISRGNITASYVLLGDATYTGLATASSPQPTWSRELVPQPDISLDAVIAQDVLLRTIGVWKGPVAEAARNAPNFETILDTCIKAAHASRLRLITQAEADGIASAAQCEVDRAQATLLDAFARASGQSIWPQQMYAAVSRPVRCRHDTCPACHRAAVRHEFDPWRHGLLPTYGLECDQCGTVCDVVGPGSPLGLKMRCDASTLYIDVPPLPDRSEGRIAVYRAIDVDPLPWPPAGGTLRFDIDRLPFRGKTTAVGLHTGAGHLTAEYATVFTAPLH